MRNAPFIIFVKGTAVMPPYVILSVSEVSTRFFTSFRMTGYCVRNDNAVCKASLRSRRMTDNVILSVSEVSERFFVSLCT